jgi:hypothetical protein
MALELFNKLDVEHSVSHHSQPEEDLDLSDEVSHLGKLSKLKKSGNKERKLKKR